MKSILFGSIALAALVAGPTMAADMTVKARPPVTVPYSWTGFYVGANLGGYWGKDNITATFDPIGWTFAAPALDSQSAGSVTPRGVIAGAQAGYNWQMNNVVLGIEADANWLGGTGSRTVVYNVAGVGVGDFMANSTKAPFLATLRPRLGIVFDRALLYATGGLAIGIIKTDDSFGAFGGAVVTSTSNSTTRTGWTVGGGAEYAFADRWSAKIEYLYVDLGSFDTSIPSCTLCGPGSDVTVHHKYTDHIVRAGLNFKLN